VRGTTNYIRVKNGVLIMAGKKAVTSYLVYEPHNRDNSQKNCRSVVSILEAVTRTSEKQQNCSICDKCQKNCRSLISILEAVISEKQQNCSSNLQPHENIQVVAVKYKVLVERETYSSDLHEVQKMTGHKLHTFQF